MEVTGKVDGSLCGRYKMLVEADGSNRKHMEVCVEARGFGGSQWKSVAIYLYMSADESRWKYVELDGIGVEGSQQKSVEVDIEVEMEVNASRWK